MELLKHDYKELKNTLKHFGFKIGIMKDCLHIVYQGEKSYSFKAPINKKYVRANATLLINRIQNGEEIIYRIPKMSLLEVGPTGNYYFYKVPGSNRKLAIAKKILHNKIRLIFSLPFDVDRLVIEKFPLTYFSYAETSN